MRKLVLAPKYTVFPPFDRINQKIWYVLKNQPCDIGLPLPHPHPRLSNKHIHAYTPQEFPCREGLEGLLITNTNTQQIVLSPMFPLPICPISVNVDFAIFMQFLAILFKMLPSSPPLKNSTYSGNPTSCLLNLYKQKKGVKRIMGV